MNKRRILLLLCFLLSMARVMAQEIIIGTNMAYGETMSFRIVPVSAADSIFIDWGDGERKGDKLGTGRWDPKVFRASGKLLSDTVRVYTSVKEFTIQDAQVTVLKLKGQSGMTKLDASRNELTTDGLDLAGATSLETLTLSGNQINNLNLSKMMSLKQFSANDNPHLYTVVFPDGNSVLNSISMNNCEIVHFYPYNLPGLKYLNIEGGRLQDIELGSHYPALQKLNLYGNKILEAVDVTKLTELEDLNVGGTAIIELNTSMNKELTTLNISNTRLTSIDLKNNEKVQTLNAKLSKIKELDLSKQTNLRYLYVDSTNIARLNMAGKKFIRELKARNTKIEFLDLHEGMGYNTLNLLDIRDCENMTPQTLNFTYQALPYHNGSSRNVNIFLAGTPYEHSKTELIPRDASNYYKVDVEGDGTAPMDAVAITLKSVDGGTCTLMQTSGVSENLEENFVLRAISNEAVPGYPITARPTPAEGYSYEGVKVNGKMYRDTVFVVSAAATIEPVFKNNSGIDVIKLTVTPATPQEYALATDVDGSQVSIDWGNGQPDTYTLSSTKTTSVSCPATYGSTVTITGRVAYADFSSYPPIANDNKIKAIDLTNNDKLVFLSLYTNELSSLDLSNQTKLVELNIGNCELGSIDLTACAKLKKLKARSNNLSSIDLSHCPELTKIELVGNGLTSLDLSNNTKLEEINVASNKIGSVDLSGLRVLNTLSLQGNKLTSIDLKDNTQLVSLDVSDNSLTSINLSNNLQLKSLYVWGNLLDAPDLSKHTQLSMIDVSSNAWDACTLNDFYYHLPEYNASGATSASSINLKVQTANTSKNAANEVERSETTLASGKGWTLNKKGDGTGCDKSYVTVLPYKYGTVRLLDTDNKEIKSGTTVKKNSVVKVEATPVNSSNVQSIKANGLDVTNGQFIVTRATDVRVVFTVPTGIEGIDASTLTVGGGRGEISITASSPTNVSVYSANGKQVFNGVVKDGKTIAAPAGIYVVKAGNTTRKIAVR